MLKFPAPERKPEFVPNPNLSRLASALTPAEEMTIAQVPKNAALMAAGTFT